MLLFVAFSGVGGAQETFDPPPERTPDGLHRVHNTPFELAYRRSDVDFSRYRKIQIRPISIAYADTPDLTRAIQRVERNYRLSDEQRTRVSRAFATSFTRAMTADNRWELTTEPGYDTVMIRIALANLSVHVPSGSTFLDKEMMLDEAAEVTLVAELRDSTTGQAIARGRDTQSIRLQSGSFKPSENKELRQSVLVVFDRWTKLLRERLDRLVDTR